MKVLIISDFRDWAFGHISKDIKKFTQDDVDITIIYLNENAIDIAQNTWKKYDIVFIMGWHLYRYFEFIPKEKVITGINSFCQWDFDMSNGKRIFPPIQKFIDYLRGFCRINVISKRLIDLFSDHDLSDIYYTPNGVDCDLFRPKKDIPDKFIAGVIAKSYRWKLKNINKIFIPATRNSQVNHRILSGETSYENMPDFYNSLSCYVCTSKSEGFSMSCLEAGACGRPLISTNISGTEEMIIPKKTGFIADMSIDSVSEKIDLLKNDIEKCKCMGDAMREHIVENYSWQKVISYWVSFFKGENDF